MQVKHLFLLVISLIFLSGCGSSKRMVVAEQKELPSWYVQVPKSTPSDLYAVGTGQNRQDAITDALTQMISTLGVSVSSEFSSRTIVKEGSKESYDATFTRKSKSEVKQVRISNYELVEAENLGYKKYAVLVKSNKKKLFESMKKELEQKFYKIAQREKIALNQNMLYQLNFYRDTLDELSSLENELIIMSELRSDFDTNKYLDKYNALDKKYATIYKKISFSFESNANAKNLEAPLAKAISEKKLHISSRKGRGHFTIKIISHIERASSYGFTLARSSISIQVKDYKGTVIGSNKLNIVGQSTQGFTIAKQNVAIKLEALIKKEGISKILGISI